MGNIHDALKRAQQARERLRADPNTAAPSAAGASGVPMPAKPSIDPAAPGAHPEVQSTPLTNALKRGTVSNADTAAQRLTDAVIENYQPATRLALDPRLVVYHDKAGALAEQYRRVRANLMAANTRGEPQMLAVTSSVAGEGKTVTVANLGLSLAEIRATRTLLIDGDLQRGALSHYMKYPGARGISELFTSGEKPDAYIQATPWPNLFVLPSGATGPAKLATDTLRLPHVRATLRHLRNMFDIVLIDTPPALRFPDAGIMASAGDGALLVVGLNQTRRAHVQRTVRLFQAMNIAIRGCVLAQHRA